MLYLVDGYNVTRSDPATADLGLESQREALLARLRVRGASMLGAGTITVVFDGRAGTGVSRGAVSPVDVRFSRGDESADDLIVRLASQAAEVTVVTSDSGLSGRALDRSGRQARVLPRETVYEAANTRARRGGKRYPARAAGLPRGANKVTEELKRLWLPDDKE